MPRYPQLVKDIQYLRSQVLELKEENDLLRSGSHVETVEVVREVPVEVIREVTVEVVKEVPVYMKCPKQAEIIKKLRAKVKGG